MLVFDFSECKGTKKFWNMQILWQGNGKKMKKKVRHVPHPDNYRHEMSG